jgi:hypothetical protein
VCRVAGICGGDSGSDAGGFLRERCWCSGPEECRTTFPENDDIPRPATLHGNSDGGIHRKLPIGELSPLHSGLDAKIIRRPVGTLCPEPSAVCGADTDSPVQSSRIAGDASGRTITHSKTRDEKRLSAQPICRTSRQLREVAPGRSFEKVRLRMEPRATLSITLFNPFRLARNVRQVGLFGIRRANMNREMALKIVLALVGMLFLALLYPLAVFMRQEPALSMMFSLYVTLGIFLLLAIRNPWASRSVIAFTAWSSFAHAAVMGTQALRSMISRGELIGVAVLIVIGAALIALAPAKNLRGSPDSPVFQPTPEQSPEACPQFGGFATPK